MTYDLVFEGGGAKGIVFVGALRAFEEAGHTPGRLLGTSAGAITACLLAVGYSSAEMLEALGETVGGRSVFAGFLGRPRSFDAESVEQSALASLLRSIDLPMVPNALERSIADHLVRRLADHDTLRHAFSLLERGGWYSADPFVAWLTARLDHGENNGAPRAYGRLTLAELHARTGKDVSFIAADTTGGQMLVLNHRTAPGVPVVWAVRMSMGIPLLWEEVVWPAAWGPYRGRSLEGHAVVDGGLLSNFPIELLASRDPEVLAVMGPEPSGAILGLLIDESLEVPGAPMAAAATPHAGQRTVARFSNLVNTLLEARDKRVMEALAPVVLRLPAAGFGTAEFEIAEARRALLVDAGYERARAYLDERAAHQSFGADAATESLSPRARTAATKGAARLLGLG